MAKAKKYPKDIGACLKALAKVQKEQEKLTAKIAPIAAEEAAIREHILQAFKKSQIQGARGSGLSLSLAQTTVPNIEDYEAFMRYATKKANWDLLARKVISAAWKERLEAKKNVPGIKPFDMVSLRVSKS